MSLYPVIRGVTLILNNIIRLLKGRKMKNTKIFKLNKNLNIEAYNGSELIIDEIWRDNYYDKDFKIDAGMTVVDIGANQGIFALYAACKGAFVYCFEPSIDNYKILVKNVSNSGLGHLIKTFNYAVSDKDGEIELFIPETEHFVTSGGITIKRKIVSDIAKKSRLSLSTEYVKSRSMISILKEIKHSEIDLMKIDCEGAELDIFAGLKKTNISAVKNIVMETHDAYNERSLYHQLIDCGFSIANYDKIGGYYKIGYLFAVNRILEHQQSPAAKLSGESHFLNMDSILFDASESFSVVSHDSQLKYRWWMNGVLLTGVRGEVVKGKDIASDLIVPGINTVTLEVESDGLKDKENKKFLYLSNNHFDLAVDYILPSENYEFELKQCANARLSIPSKLIPQHWRFKCIYIRVRYAVLSDSDSYSCRLTVHSITTLLDKYETVLEVENIDQNIDIIIDLKSQQNNSILITWSTEKSMMRKYEGDTKYL
jgi:FkbM family methyltransferase